MKECLNCGMMNPNNAPECEDCEGTRFGAPEHEEPSPFQPQVPVPVPVQPSAGSTGGIEEPRVESGPGREDSDRRSRTYLDQLEKLTQGDHKPRIVMMFGFSSSGKSFFIARAKHSDTGLGYNVYPKLPAPNDKDARLNGIKLDGTKGIEVHTMRDGKDVVVLVDVEGEYFAEAARNDFQGANDLFLEAISYADGFIFMLPAAETLMPTRWEESNEDIAQFGRAEGNIETLRSSLERITAFIEFAEVKKKVNVSAASAAAEFRTLDPAVLMNMGNASRSTRPALVLLSKADGFKQLCVQNAGNLKGGSAEDWASRFDGDPMGRLSRAEHVGARWIIKAFDRAFKRFRVDFVTAFDGHEEFPERDPEHRNIRYNMKSAHYGVADNFNWLKREIDRSRNPFFRRLDPGVWPAIALRKFFDPGFARVWSDGSRKPGAR